jgi:nitrogen fixation NifU-like protein
VTDLYQAALIDHARRPRNFGALAGFTHAAEGSNPLCGDELMLRLRVAEGRVAAAAFEGAGCAVCLGSASMLTVAAAGLAVGEARALIARVEAMLDGGPPHDVGELAALAGAARFPARVKCAKLAWRAFSSALDAGARVSTESGEP